MKKQKSIDTTPLTRWLLEYVDAHAIDLTDLAKRAGLSAASLYALINNPECVLTLETCMRLSMATGRSVNELLQMAGLDGNTPVENLDPDRLELLRSYRELPRQMRRTLRMIAQVLEESISPEEYRETLLFLFGRPLPAALKGLCDVALVAAEETNKQNICHY